MREHPVKSFCILHFTFFFFGWVYIPLPFREYSTSARARKHFTNYTVCNKKCKTLYGPSWKLDFCFERLFCWQRFFSKSVYHVNTGRKLTIHFIKKCLAHFQEYCIYVYDCNITRYYYCLVQLMCFITQYCESTTDFRTGESVCGKSGFNILE